MTKLGALSAGTALSWYVRALRIVERELVGRNHINRIVIAGNLTRDVELRATESTHVARLRIASNELRQQTDMPNYVTVVVFGSQAEACAQWLEKGSPVIVDGKLRWSEWTPDDGIRREKLEVIASDVQFLPRAGAREQD